MFMLKGLKRSWRQGCIVKTRPLSKQKMETNKHKEKVYKVHKVLSMIQHRTMLQVADNTGAKNYNIRVLGGYKKDTAVLATLCAVKEAHAVWLKRVK